jgi:hypothetical protein
MLLIYGVLLNVTVLLLIETGVFWYCTLVEKGGNGNVYVRFYCGFYSVDVAVAFLNHFLTVCRTNITIRQFPLPPLFY